MSSYFVKKVRQFLVRKELSRFLCACQRNFAGDASENSSLYKALGVKSSATQSEIKQAYYDLTFKYHPDRNKGSDDAADKFKEVTEAYEILGDFYSRKMYDNGVPFSPSPIKIKKALEEKDVQYQKFYDSRSSRQKSQIVHDEAEEKNEEHNHHARAFESSSSSGVQLVIVVFLCVCAYITRGAQ